MEIGAKCICSEDDWYNAFGEKPEVIKRGMRLTVRDKRMVGGAQFYYFEELNPENCFMSTGFTPLRNLN
jgi:hypothetical protein